LIRIQEDKDFLFAQREIGRRKKIGNLNRSFLKMKADCKEDRKNQNKTREERRKN